MKAIPCKVILLVVAIMCTSATGILLCDGPALGPVLASTLCFSACAGFPSRCTDEGVCVCLGRTELLGLRVIATCEPGDPGTVCDTVCVNLEDLGLGQIARAECIDKVCNCFYKL